MIDVTSLNEPDPAWAFTDAAGHEHRWVGDWRHSDLPTLEWVWDDPEDVDSDYPRRGHYECRECRAKVEPRTMASPCRRLIPGPVTDGEGCGMSRQKEEPDADHTT